MIKLDESALICDFAETYHILDYRALPLKTAAVLASGLRDNSRIMMKISGMQVSPETALMAAAVDRLSLLFWAKTKDAESGSNRPESILAKLTGENEKKDSDLQSFDTAEEFEAARQRILQGGG